jgi:hypothetical protein
MAQPRRATNKARVIATGTTKGQAVTKIEKELNYQYQKHPWTATYARTLRAINEARDYDTRI